MFLLNHCAMGGGRRADTRDGQEKDSNNYQRCVTLASPTLFKELVIFIFRTSSLERQRKRRNIPQTELSPTRKGLEKSEFSESDVNCIRS
jgi:hypothetical protein